MPNLPERIEATTQKLTQQLRAQAIKEYAAKERERKTQRQADNATRKADSHRKITLGGLVIASGVDGWNEAEIVGALLHMAGHLHAKPEDRATLRDRGINHLEARAANRKEKK
jgi:hypothetical protein